MNVTSMCREPCDKKCAGEPRSCNLECYKEKGCSLAYGKCKFISNYFASKRITPIDDTVEID